MSALLTLSEAKQFIRISTESVDAVLQVLIDGAEDFASQVCGTPFTTSEYVDIYDGGGEFLWLTQCPVIAVSSIVDLYNTSSVLDTSHYSGSRNRVMYNGGTTQNLRWQPGADRWQITYTAGYNNGNSVKPQGSVAAPAGLKLAVLELVHRVYESRGGVSSTSSQGISRSFGKVDDSDIQALFEPYIVGSRF